MRQIKKEKRQENESGTLVSKQQEVYGRSKSETAMKVKSFETSKSYKFSKNKICAFFLKN